MSYVDEEKKGEGGWHVVQFSQCCKGLNSSNTVFDVLQGEVCRVLQQVLWTLLGLHCGQS